MLKLAPYLPGDMAPSVQIYKAIAVNEEEEEEGDSEREEEEEEVLLTAYNK